MTRGRGTTPRVSLNEASASEGGGDEGHWEQGRGSITTANSHQTEKEGRLIYLRANSSICAGGGLRAGGGAGAKKEKRKHQR